VCMTHCFLILIFFNKEFNFVKVPSLRENQLDDISLSLLNHYKIVPNQINAQ